MAQLTFPYSLSGRQESRNRSFIRSDSEFKVVTNVRRADVRETTGWVDVELSGETAEIERAIDGTPDQRLRRRSD